MRGKGGEVDLRNEGIDHRVDHSRRKGREGWHSTV